MHHQAGARAVGDQQRARDLVVEDGWRYFVHGWSQVVADVFAIPMPRETVRELADIATDVRARSPLFEHMF